MKQYQELTIQMQKIRRAEERLNILMQNKLNLEYELKEKKRQLEVEEYDVEKLEGLSLNGFLHLIKGTLMDQLDKEEKEAMLAKKAYESSRDALSECLKKIDEARQVIKDKLDVKRAYDTCIKTLEKDLVHKSPELREILQDQAYSKEVLREIREAEEAGRSLNLSLKSLNEHVGHIKEEAHIDESGFFSHNDQQDRVQEVNRLLLTIQEQCHGFELELLDVFDVCDLNWDLSFLRQFSDFLLEGMVHKKAVESKLGAFLAYMEGMAVEMNRVMTTLADQKENIGLFIKKLGEKKQACVEGLLEAENEEDMA